MFGYSPANDQQGFVWHWSSDSCALRHRNRSRSPLRPHRTVPHRNNSPRRPDQHFRRVGRG